MWLVLRYLSLAEINWKEFPLRVLRFNGGVVNTEVKRLRILNIVKTEWLLLSGD